MEYAMRKFDQQINTLKHDLSIINEIDTTNGLLRFLGSLTQTVTPKHQPFITPKYSPDNFYVLLGGLQQLPKLRKQLQIDQIHQRAQTKKFDPTGIQIGDILVGSRQKNTISGLFAVKSLPNPQQVEVYPYSLKTKIRQSMSKPTIQDRSFFAGYYNTDSLDPYNPDEALAMSPKAGRHVFNTDGSINKQNIDILNITIYNALMTSARSYPKNPHFELHELITGELLGKNKRIERLNIKQPMVPEDKVHANLMKYLKQNAPQIIYMTPTQSEEAKKGNLFKQALGTVGQKAMDIGKQFGRDVINQATTNQIVGL
jgi:hypothetical protein